MSNDNDSCLLLDITDQRYVDFIATDEKAAIFHHPNWIQLMQKSYGYRPFAVAVNDNEGKLCAVTPMMEVNLGGKRWVSLPFSDYCNPLSRDETALAALGNGLLSFYDKHKVKKAEFHWKFPSHPQIRMQEPYLFHTILLDPDPKVMAKRATRQQMQNVRTAEKNEIRIVRGSGLEEMRAFYHMHCLTRRKHGLPVQPWKFFRLLSMDLIEKGMGFILLAYHGDACLAGGVFLHMNKTLTYKYSATLEESMKLRPNHLLTWNAIQWGCENGFTTFDFGRADLVDTGLSEYKRRWGADETSLTYSYYPSAPDMGGKGRHITIMQTIIRRSPLWVCQLTGELFYRYIG